METYDIIVTLTNPRIEKAKNVFFVKFLRAPYYCLGKHPAEISVARVFAETKNGALDIAREHFSNSSQFEIVVPKGLTENFAYATSISV
jgi:hypothetical protein